MERAGRKEMVHPCLGRLRRGTLPRGRGVWGIGDSTLTIWVGGHSALPPLKPSNLGGRTQCFTTP